MPKINRVSSAPSYWKVLIKVTDEDGIFSIGKNISYMKVFKALSANTAIRAAATYCNKYMKEYPGVEFSYSTKEVEPYYYPITYNYYSEEK